MADINAVAQVLEQSLSPSLANQAGETLKSLDAQQGFPLTLLHVAASNELPQSIRLAGSLYFKNLVKRKWMDESGNYGISKSDADSIKSQIVKLMITLPDSLQVQIGESISLIAESEFPEIWPQLLDELVECLNSNDMIVIKGVLRVSHSIFKRWRPATPSDDLYLEIKMVLGKFAAPFLQLLQRVDVLIGENSTDKAALNLLFENLQLLVKIYYDLNCQDIPEFFEDNLNTGMNTMHKYLTYSNPLLDDPDNEDEVEPITLVKTQICDLIHLYTTRYGEEFSKFIPTFIQTVWDLLKLTGLQSKYDILVSRALNFLTAIASLESYGPTLNNETALKEITENIILPNATLRESDEEMFEDDPIEYTRRDLEGSDSDTRRRSSTDFLRALKDGNEQVVTNVVNTYVNHYLSDFQSNPTNWKSKDLALYLFSAIAANGSITNSGLTSTNLLVDVVQFFTNYVAPDLVNQVSHPILKVDAIKYIFTFRNQLTKEQLINTFELLSSHFQDNNYVVYTYTAITIEKILGIRNPNNHQELLFNKKDIPPAVSQNLLMSLFTLMFKQGEEPEKLAENEFLMKCIMRILLTAQDSLNEFSLQLLDQLLRIIEIIGKNPSNPRFSHYAFESICVLIKYNVADIEAIVEKIRDIVLSILGLEIQEFTPYAFQILAYCLEVYPKTKPLPEFYKALVKPLCDPSIWQYRGNIPAIERLLKAIVEFKPELFSDAQRVTPILGVFQKLVSSKTNDHLGFEFLEAVLINIDLSVLQPFLKDVGVIILSRLNQSRTDKFVKRFVIFLCSLSCLSISQTSVNNKNNLNSTFAYSLIDNVQSGVFNQVFGSFIVPYIIKFNNILDKKLLIVGLINLISENGNSIDPQKSTLAISQLLKLLSSDSIKDYKTMNENYEIMIGLENDDFTFGSSFNRLNIIQNGSFDPIKNEINNQQAILDYFKMKLSSFELFRQRLAYDLDDESKVLLQQLGIA